MRQMARPFQKPSSDRLDPRIRYYIYRKHANSIVPLVPVDQLPIDLEGIPKTLDSQQLSEGGWKFLGKTYEVPYPFALLRANVGDSLKAIEKVTTEKTSAREYAKKSNPPEQTTTAPPAITERQSLSKIESLTDSMAAIYTKDAHRVGYKKAPTTGKREGIMEGKEYCHHWVKTGKCKYSKFGCKHKHQMPALDQLERMGITELPRWHRQKDPFMGKIRLLGSTVESARGQSTGKRDVDAESDIRTPIEHAANESCGRYTTNTADEPMLMDINADTDSAQPVHHSVQIPSVAAKTAGDAQIEPTAATRSESTSASEFETVQSICNSNSVDSPVPKTSAGSSGYTSPTPLNTTPSLPAPKTAQEPATPLSESISISSSVPTSSLAPEVSRDRTSAFERNDSPPASPSTQREFPKILNGPSESLHLLPSASSTKGIKKTPGKHLSSLQVKSAVSVGTKKVFSQHMLDKKGVKLDSSVARHKTPFNKKEYKARMRQPVTDTDRNSGSQIIEKGLAGVRVSPKAAGCIAGMKNKNEP